jgi:hypothetical protein
MSSLQLFLYSGKHALPVYFDPYKNVFDANEAPLMSFDKKKNTMRVNEIDKKVTDKNEGDGFHADSYQLQGIIDEYTLMLWFAECCPASVTEKSKIERKPIVEIVDGKRRSSIAVKNDAFSRRSSSMGSQGRSSLRFAVPQMGGRSRRTSFNSAIGSQWRDMGLTFTTTTIAGVLKDFIPNPYAKKGYKSSFKCVLLKNVRPETPPPNEPTVELLQENKDKKTLRCEVGYTVQDVLQTDQFLFNVIDMVARGYRNVPLAASRVRPYSVSHVISCADVAAFLRLYPKECMGRLATTSVLDSGLMRLPLVVSMDLNYGSAIQHLKEFKVDTAAIIDADGRWVGRLDCRSAAIMWWRWKSLAKGVLGDQEELDMLRERFSDELYDELNVSSIKNYSAFSMMMNPLRECSPVGINIYNFEDQFKPEATKKGGFAEEDEESENSSDSGSSSSSDSDSDSSSSSSSESDEENDEDEDGDAFGGVSKLSMSVLSKDQLNEAPPTTAEEKARREKLWHQKQFTGWLQTQGLLLETDTITAALEVMTLFKSTKAFVVNEFGEVIGVVSMRSIAIEILKYESETQRQNYQKALDEDYEHD